MDGFEFRKVIELFPVVRSRDYHADLDVSSSKQLTQSASSSRQLTQSTSSDWLGAWNDKDERGTETSGNYNHEAFWGKLMLAAEQKVGAADAKKICKAFQQVYKRLVHEELTFNAAKSFMNLKNI